MKLAPLRRLFTICSTWLLFLLLPTAASAQTASPADRRALAALGWDGMPFDPWHNPQLFTNQFRKLGDHYLDLRPLFKWAQARSPRSPYRTTQQPLPGWTPLGTLTMPGGEVGLRVSQVLPTGLLCRRGETTLFMRNHPRQQTAVDGSVLQPFLACKLPERFQYKSVLGSIETVEQYDYGIPFDPQQRAREAAAANGQR